MNAPWLAALILIVQLYCRRAMPRLMSGLLSCVLAAVLAGEEDLSRLDGTVLVRQLSDPALAQRAHYELTRRAAPDEAAEWRGFVRGHYGQRAVVCPQPDGQAPITLVLYGFHQPYRRRGDYAVDNIDALFPDEPLAEGGPVTEPAIDAYAADGMRLTPFGGNNMLSADEALADLDADGWIERVDSSHYGLKDGPTVEVVSILRVRPQAEPLISLVIDWGADDWSVEVQRPQHLGERGEVRMGPRDASGRVLARAVLRPDAGGHWSLAPGWPSDHVAELAGTDIWAALAAVKARLPVFSSDPSAPENRRKAPAPASAAKAPVPPATPFIFRSLGSDPGAVATFMGQGRSIRDLEREATLTDVLPDALWTLPPRAAALALVEANRSEVHRARYRLAIDDRDGIVPPVELCVDLAVDSSRCYTDLRQSWRLRSTRDEALLAATWTWQGGAVLRDGVAVQPRQAIRIAAIDPAAARQAATVVWWLDRVRSLDRIGDHHVGMSSSTADGRGRLRVADGSGQAAFVRSDRLWSGSVPERWRSDYDHETLLNLSRLVILRALAPRTGFVVPGRQNDDDPAALRTAAMQVLARPDRFGNAIVLRAVEAAGVHAWQDCDGDLRRIAATLPAGLPALRTYAQIDAEIQELRTRPEAHETLMLRYAELFALDQDGAEAPQTLAAAIVLARERIRLADDLPGLRGLAAGDGPQGDWALARLVHAERTSYIAALERRLAHSDGWTARNVFAALAAADPARARILAAAQPKDVAGALTVDAFAALDQTAAPEDPAQRAAGLLAVLADAQQGWEQRTRAIELLVPADAPLRFTDMAIDAALAAALAAALDPAGTDSSDLYLATSAARALSRRGRVEHLGRMVDLLASGREGWSRSNLLMAAVELAPRAEAAVRQRLQAWIAQQLEETSLRITDVLWAAWVLDQRTLLPAVEAIATADPGVAEGPMVTSYGGTPRRVAEYRYHLARRIAQVWRETDAAARTLLLLTIDGEPVHEWTPLVRQRLAAEFDALHGDPAAIRAAVDWSRLRATQTDSDADRRFADILRRLGAEPAGAAP